MTIYNRPDEKVFASGAKPGELAPFPDIERGWGLSFEQTEGKPPMEWMNDVFRRMDEAIRYLVQRGISEWSPTEDYPAGAQADRQGVTYRALVANKNADPATTGAAWTQGAIMVLPTAPELQMARTIYAEDREQILRWKTIGTFTGYVSPEVGCLSYGTQPDPRPFEVDLIGQTLDKTTPKYAALYAWANAMGRFVAAGSWAAGTYFFCEMGGNLFRVPDLRNMFIRFTGTDIDTANATILGGKKSDQAQIIKGGIYTRPTILAQGGAVAEVNGAFGTTVGVKNSTIPSGFFNMGSESGFLDTVTFDSSRVARAGKETSPLSTFLHPRINL